MANGCTLTPGTVPAEKTFKPWLKDFKNPSAIWLRQLFPVHKINIFIILDKNGAVKI
jgi:hypothetical protein